MENRIQIILVRTLNSRQYFVHNFSQKLTFQMLAVPGREKVQSLPSFPVNKMILHSLGPILADFNSFLSNDRMGVCQHKLDSYVSKSASHEADLFFMSGEDTLWQEILDGAKELRVYPYGIYFEHVHMLTDQSLLYSYVRRDTREVLLQYHISSDYHRINVTVDKANDAGYSAFGGFSDLFSNFALSKKLITFHGVLLEDEGRGIIISANSGVGKTTHARLWRDVRNSIIINGDRTFCNLSGGKWIGYGLPWSGTSGEYVNRKVPVNVFVNLKRGSENRTRILTGMEAFQAAFTQVKYPKWDIEKTDVVLNMLEEFLEQVPVIELTCRPDADSVKVLDQAIRQVTK